MRPFLLVLALAFPSLALGAKGESRAPAAAVGQAAAATAALQGEWMILGPASLAHLPLMMEFTFQQETPTAEEMSAAHLDADQQRMVHDARARAAANPNDAELVEMRATLHALQQARVIIGPDTITARAGEDVDVVRYKVLRHEGLQIVAHTVEPDGTELEVTFTLPGKGLLMMGPKGAEPLVLRRAN